ncbi:CPBP family intramembrane glutamic endopeptidase [Brachybacterium sp. ACRRE]|uniref:CPBP family intramembrane glutamic endopeptidase n=1 Tax=Brachybacterium sp. ACRRE TaxID=2918184 RepID=UPI001EF2A1A9|nr:CPBP family intramembrane glutamic endopeptidase [Brachybacterium sp. ACRRE]MCG7308008.1 CPBP family intramembrane metalloprotease [Brachybacterium sp. ACRRE]
MSDTRQWTRRPRRDVKLRLWTLRQARRQRQLALPDGAHISPVLAWVVVLGLYGVKWWRGIINAAEYLQTHEGPDPITLWDSALYLGEALAMLALGVIVLGALADAVKLPRAAVGLEPSTYSGWRLAACLYGAWTVANLVQVVISILTSSVPIMPPRGHYPTPVHTSAAAGLVDIPASALSGAVEELVVLAIPVVALRAAGYRWLTVYAVAVILRCAFHIYYGVSAIPGFVVWSLLLVMLYHLFGRIWPLFLAHAANNALSMSAAVVGEFAPRFQHVADAINVAGKLVPAALGLVVLLFLLSMRTLLVKARPSRDQAPRTEGKGRLRHWS